MKTRKAKLSIDLATKMFNGTDPQLKEFALENFPELRLPLPESIKSYEDACKLLGETPYTLSDLCSKDEVAYIKLKTIVKALNEGWTPDWDNSSNPKYYPWFKMSSSDGGFSFFGCGCVDSSTAVGSRFVFKNRERAEYAGKQFIELYKQLLTV